jgi:GGDEF domain-containing protein
LRLGISIGVSQFPQDGTTPGALLAAADERMYAQKRRRKKSSRKVISA